MKRGVHISKSEEKELKHRTRRLSIKEGILWSGRASLGDYFVAPFAVFVNMSTPLIAILNSLWSLGPIAQLFGSKKIGKTSRKSILTKTMLIDALGWFVLALIAFLYLKDIGMTFLPYLIILDIATILLSCGYGHPSWFSWMGDVVDAKYRGRWFSKRSTIISFTTIIFAISASFYVEHAKEIGKTNIAFIILFLLAFLFRLYSMFTIRRHYEPELKIGKEKKIPVKKIIEEYKKTNLGKFTIFRGILALIIGLTSPLISIYLLRYLGLDYVTYMAIYLSGTLFSVITLNLWGKIADKYGNYRVIALTTIIIPFTPILWILSSSPLYLFIVPAILGGTAWSAFIMASGNFIYDNTTKKTRGRSISYFNFLTAVGGLVGGLISSLLIDVIHTTWIEPIPLIFISGSILRMFIIGYWVPKLKEIKKKNPLNGLKDIENIILREVRPTITEDFHEIGSIGKYLKE